VLVGVEPDVAGSLAPRPDPLLIGGFVGACDRSELVSLGVCDVEDCHEALVLNIGRSVSR
jgi:hypothetical protein